MTSCSNTFFFFISYKCRYINNEASSFSVVPCLPRSSPSLQIVLLQRRFILGVRSPSLHLNFSSFGSGKHLAIQLSISHLTPFIQHSIPSAPYHGIYHGIYHEAPSSLEPTTRSSTLFDMFHYRLRLLTNTTHTHIYTHTHTSSSSSSSSGIHCIMVKVQVTTSTKKIC